MKEWDRACTLEVVGRDGVLTYEIVCLPAYAHPDQYQGLD